jgi:hypothetical protein
MRIVHVAFIVFIIGVAVLIMQGGHQQRLVQLAPFGTAEAGSAQAMASSDVPTDYKTNAQDLEAEAEVLDEEADKIQTQVMKYKREAAAITPMEDTKGFRRSALRMAAASQTLAVQHLRQLAAHHRAEAQRMLAKAPAQ